VGENVCVCFSPDLSHSEDIAIYEAIPVSNDSDCTAVAKEALVYRDIAVTDSMPSKTSSNTQSFDSGSRKSKMKICHQNPEILNLTAWLLSTNVSKQRDFRNQLENCSQLHGEMVQKEIILRNSKSTIVGVVDNKWIPIQLI